MSLGDWSVSGLRPGGPAEPGRRADIFAYRFLATCGPASSLSAGVPFLVVLPVLVRLER
jgi:hypothetical protein